MDTPRRPPQGTWYVPQANEGLYQHSFGVLVLCDYFCGPTGLYHTPGVFFTPGSRQEALCHAVEAATPPLLVSAELCGLNPSPEVRMMQIWMHGQ